MYVGITVDAQSVKFHVLPEKMFSTWRLFLNTNKKLSAENRREMELLFWEQILGGEIREILLSQNCMLTFYVYLLCLVYLKYKDTKHLSEITYIKNVCKNFPK